MCYSYYLVCANAAIKNGQRCKTSLGDEEVSFLKCENESGTGHVMKRLPRPHWDEREICENCKAGGKEEGLRKKIGVESWSEFVGW
jgi:hypothetical protein